MWAKLRRKPQRGHYPRQAWSGTIRLHLASFLLSQIRFYLSFIFGNSSSMRDCHKLLIERNPTTPKHNTRQQIHKQMVWCIIPDMCFEDVFELFWHVYLVRAFFSRAPSQFCTSGGRGSSGGVVVMSLFTAPVWDSASSGSKSSTSSCLCSVRTHTSSCNRSCKSHYCDQCHWISSAGASFIRWAWTQHSSSHNITAPTHVWTMT